MLFHASTNKELEVIEPQWTVSQDKYIGEFVFATTNKTYAAMYLSPKGRPSLLSVFSGKSYLVLNDTPQKFLKDDHGGAIYEVSADTFEASPQAELSETEVVSRQPVVPLHKELFDTSLQAFQAMQVPVYFVDAKQFDEIQHAEDHGWSILQSLKPYI